MHNSLGLLTDVDYERRRAIRSESCRNMRLDVTTVLPRKGQSAHSSESLERPSNRTPHATVLVSRGVEHEVLQSVHIVCAGNSTRFANRHDRSSGLRDAASWCNDKAHWF
jgi:hypothetical protein